MVHGFCGQRKRWYDIQRVSCHLFIAEDAETFVTSGGLFPWPWKVLDLSPFVMILL
jgi:hypothetical protein